MKPLESASVLLALFLLLPSRVAAAADGGVDASGEAGAPSALIADAGTDAASDDTSDQVPLGCDGSLCTTATGATTCAVSEGHRAQGGAWPFALALAVVAATGIKRRARRTRRKVS
jgi:hypothetical protein